MENVAEFLVGRLENAGIRHVMTVPGDFILGFLEKLLQSKKIDLVNCADESGAGFAADGYARASGIGCVAVTYNVGALKLCNPIAGAFAERSPVVVISGSPATTERSETPIHHQVGSFDCQRQVFKNITCAQTVLDNPLIAGYEIDRVFEALKYHKQPVYIELPRDIVLKPVNYDVYTQGTPKIPQTDVQNLEDAIKEVTNWIEAAKNPVILAGVEIGRCNLGRQLVKFAEKNNIPIVCTLLSKSVVDETNPLYVGVYAGSNSSKLHVREMVEKSDCLLVCGEVITEATVGYRPSKAWQKREMVTATISELKVKNHQYPNVSFVDFCNSLFKTEITKKVFPDIPEKVTPKYIPDNKKLTTIRLFEKLDAILDENNVIVADTGDSLLGASDLSTLHEAGTFFGPAFYLSMGFAIPAALGIQLAKPKKRPLVIVGDGGFQMSLSEISTMIRWKLNPIIFVLNNRGYSTERVMLDGKFNNILDWNYHLTPELMGGGSGMKVETEEELEEAVGIALKSNSVYVINCVVTGISPALARIGTALKKKICIS